MHNFTFFLLKVNFSIVISSAALPSSSRVLYGLQIKVLCSFLISSTRATCLISWSGNRILFSEGYKMWRSPLRHFPRPLVTFFLLLWNAGFAPTVKATPSLMMYAELPRTHLKDVFPLTFDSPLRVSPFVEIHVCVCCYNICFILCSVQDIKNYDVETFLAFTFQILLCFCERQRSIGK
jgi:hypothetical protein